MSRMETVHLKMERCDTYAEQFFRKQTEGMDDYDLSDYCSDNNLYVKDGEWWEFTYNKELDESGFTEVLNKTGSSVEFITSFYNGGACLEDIIGYVLRCSHETK